jgi:hypothetical protein
MHEFSKRFTEVCHIRKPDIFETKWAQLIVDYPQAGLYLNSNIYVNKRQWCSAWTDMHITFGAHSTQRVEVMNNYIKMFDVNNSTQLIQLFEVLKQAGIEQAKKSSDRRAKQAISVASHAQSLIQRMEQHLTVFAAQFINQQYGFVENYSHNVPGVANCIVVSNKLKADSVIHGVIVTANSMYCDCNMPSNYLLPCRHVLLANKILFGDVFQVNQIHQRWCHSFMPPPLSTVQSISHHPSLSSSAIPDIYIPRTEKSMSQEDRFSNLLSAAKVICNIGSIQSGAYDTLLHYFKVIEAQFHDHTENKSNRSVSIDLKYVYIMIAILVSHDYIWS